MLNNIRCLNWAISGMYWCQGILFYCVNITPSVGHFVNLHIPLGEYIADYRPLLQKRAGISTPHS